MPALAEIGKVFGEIERRVLFGYSEQNADNARNILNSKISEADRKRAKDKAGQAKYVVYEQARQIGLGDMVLNELNHQKPLSQKELDSQIESEAANNLVLWGLACRWNPTQPR